MRGGQAKEGVNCVRAGMPQSVMVPGEERGLPRLLGGRRSGVMSAFISFLRGGYTHTPILLSPAHLLPLLRMFFLKVS